MKRFLYERLGAPVTIFAVLCFVFPVVAAPLVILLDVLQFNPMFWFKETAVGLRIAAFLIVVLFLWLFSRQIAEDRNRWWIERVEREASTLRAMEEPSYWANKDHPTDDLQPTISPELRTICRYLAKEEVKAAMKQRGLKVSHIEPWRIAKAADYLYLSDGARLREKAAIYLQKRAKRKSV